MASKSALPLLALAGAAVVLMSGKKKKRKSSAGYEDFDYESFAVPPTPPPPAATKTAGPSGKTAGSDIWKQRQTALAFVAGMKVCNCHPGSIDGAYGPATLNAIIAFQVCAGIGVDGKWGPQTDAAMKKILAEIASGNVTVKKPSASSGESPSGSSSKTSWSANDILGYLPRNVYGVTLLYPGYTTKSEYFDRYQLDTDDRYINIGITVPLVEWINIDDFITSLREIAIDHPEIYLHFTMKITGNRDMWGKAWLQLIQVKPNAYGEVKAYKLQLNNDPQKMIAELPKVIGGWLFSVGGWLRGMEQTL